MGRSCTHLVCLIDTRWHPCVRYMETVVCVLVTSILHVAAFLARPYPTHHLTLLMTYIFYNYVTLSIKWLLIKNICNISLAIVAHTQWWGPAGPLFFRLTVSATET